jgi:hypothetical protein
LHLFREIQVLQSQDADESLVDDSSDSEADYISSILKHTQFIAFIKRSAENYLSTMMLKKHLLRAFEHLY